MDNGPLEYGVRRAEVPEEIVSTRGLAHGGHARGRAAEQMDVLLDPLKTETLVVESEVVVAVLAQRPWPRLPALCIRQGREGAGGSSSRLPRRAVPDRWIVGPDGYRLLGIKSASSPSEGQ